MRPTETEIKSVVQGWACLKFFPADPGAIYPICALLAKMVGTSEQLRWLDSAMLNQVGEWPGPAEVRAIFCTRFKPQDDNEGKGYCSIAGFTPADIESENLVKHAQLEDPHQRTGKLSKAGDLARMIEGG